MTMANTLNTRSRNHSLLRFVTQITLVFVALAGGFTTSMLAQKGPAPYELLVKKSSAFQEGLTRYELFVSLPEGHRVSSIYGTDLHPLRIVAPEGVFNSPYNGSWSASGMNPNFYEMMPTMEDDSYGTIGLRTGAKISGVANAQDPMMVQDPGAPWDAFFTVNGETTLSIETHTGGAWFVLRTAGNGAPVNGEVFLMQITTSGSLEGVLNIQLFPGSPEEDKEASQPEEAQIKCRFEFDGPGTFPARRID